MMLTDYEEEHGQEALNKSNEIMVHRRMDYGLAEELKNTAVIEHDKWTCK